MKQDSRKQSQDSAENEEISPEDIEFALSLPSGFDEESYAIGLVKLVEDRMSFADCMDDLLTPLFCAVNYVAERFPDAMLSMRNPDEAYISLLERELERARARATEAAENGIAWPQAGAGAKSLPN